MLHPPYTIHLGKKRRGTGLPVHAHDAAQLTFAASGMIELHTEEGCWLVPSQLAVWIPARTAHRLDVLSDAELWIVHLRSSTAKDWAPQDLPSRAFALHVTSLLRSLLETAVATATGPEKRDLIVKLMLHELSETADAPTFLPMPASPAGRRVADLALQDHKNLLDLNDLAARAATSVRTVSRLFPTETGLTFKAWRQRARVVRAMDRLARGDSISSVSAQSGFSSTAAFSHAFRQVTAVTPTSYIDRPRADAAR